MNENDFKCPICRRKKKKSRKEKEIKQTLIKYCAIVY